MGEAAIEAACHHIDQWPPPLPGKLLSLPLIGTLLHARIPCRSDVPQRSIYSDNSVLESITALHTIYEYDIYQNLICAINHIQLLWELILLGEPLVVMGPSPAACSQIVHSLISLTWPLRYFNDYRPFFTIHDSEFKEYTSKSGPPPNVILGVTNPFFTKTLQHYPHILRVGDANTGNIADAGKTFRKAWDGRTLDTKPGLYSQYRSFLTRDKSLYKKLSKSSNQNPEVLNSILCRHFLEITQSFMIPLERYLSSLMPLKKHISPFKSVPQARPFDSEEFLKTLTDNGPSLTCGVQGDWAGLYRRFLTSANFEGWLRSRLNDVDRQLRTIHLDVLCSTEFSKDSLSSRHEVEIVDLVLKIRDRMVEMDPITQAEKRVQLQAQLSKVLTSVDDELKSLLLSNCGLRDTVDWLPANMFSQLLTIGSLVILTPLALANDVCTFPRDKGDENCNAGGGLKFYFDVNTGVCQPFRYTGCGGNENRFDNAAKCRAACMTGRATGTQPAKAPAIKKCPSGVRSAVDANQKQLDCSKCPANHTCEDGVCCPSKELVCSLDYDAGHYGNNLSHIPRYFYSTKYGNCMLFTYYGLFGNYNNFETYNECVKFCKS
ncbi:hypothetical protein QR680_002724 [Steinernema hermaphroditum]|uniref:UDENN domain-containing protein n=1 Tax=Steinernema hermaphroditum TaxID=289476 RepID=A0AA39H3T8_9BILA|nr:hypothetical protein QR680_002724 [Steinernema hermaphroditum]